jgi:hypothetical protein
MIKSGFRYLKWTAVVAVLALTIVAGVCPSAATKQPPLSNTAASGADLANEARALAKYCDDLVAYHQQTAQLGKKASFTLAEIDPLQRRSDDLKRRLSGLQNVFREIVRKLKAANEWNDLDTTIAAKITDAGQRSFFQRDSFKQLLEDSSNDFSSHGNEISIPLDNLRKRLTSRMFSPYRDGADFQIVRAAYEAPAPGKFVSLECSINKIRAGLLHRLGGEQTPGFVDQISCACDPGRTTGRATGVDCNSI